MKESFKSYPLILDGRCLSQELRTGLAEKIGKLKDKGVVPGLTVVLIGEDPASKIYVGLKEKACQAVGIRSVVHRLPAWTKENDLLDLLDSLNKDITNHGILVQLPLPDHLDERRVIEAIDPEKDVDGIHPINMGRLLAGQEGFVPCTPAGIMEILKSYGISLASRNAVIVGRSNIVGKPIALLLLRENATVTICHSRTNNLAAHTKKADILISAVGKRHIIQSSMVKKGAVVVDVGINRNEEGKISGDVDFQSLLPLVSAITPVPGGVGPMTITMLLSNTILAAVRFTGQR